MKTSITILEHNCEIEYELKITASGCPSNGWDEPGYSAEFDIEVLELVSLAHPENSLLLPLWLKDIITAHLMERDDINLIANQIDEERGNFDPYDERE
jgi:hypothetical protein